MSIYLRTLQTSQQQANPLDISSSIANVKFLNKYNASSLRKVTAASNLFSEYKLFHHLRFPFFHFCCYLIFTFPIQIFLILDSLMICNVLKCLNRLFLLFQLFKFTLNRNFYPSVLDFAAFQTCNVALQAYDSFLLISTI